MELKKELGAKVLQSFPMDHTHATQVADAGHGWIPLQTGIEAEYRALEEEFLPQRKVRGTFAEARGDQREQSKIPHFQRHQSRVANPNFPPLPSNSVSRPPLLSLVRCCWRSRSARWLISSL